MSAEKAAGCGRSLLFHFLSLLFMALLTFLTELSEAKKQQSSNRKRRHRQKQKPTSSWDQIKNLLTCKLIEGSKIHDPSKPLSEGRYNPNLGHCGSICSFRDLVQGNTRVVHRADNPPEGSTVGQETRLLGRKSGPGSTSSLSVASSVRSSAGGGTYSSSSSSSSRGMPLRKLSGCYECHMIVDPSRYNPVARTTICACPECGEVFPKIESLDLHQAVKHAVSELGPEDSGRNIVEIIFKSGWLKKDNPSCMIERILKVHNTQRTIQRFEDFRDAVRVLSRKNPRCAADGNELLRFHCTALACSLGSCGSTNLCNSIPDCGVCTIIRHGFTGKSLTDDKGVCTTASSGQAHNYLHLADWRRAMLVCRVIAGRVRCLDDEATKREEDSNVASGSYDSIAGYAGMYSNFEELYVSNPRAILPCFVVIYKALES